MSRRSACLAALALSALAGCRSCPPCGERAQTFRQQKGRLTHPLLDVQSAVELAEVRPFRHEIQGAAREAVRSKKARFVSAYYRDLNNGPWFGVESQAKFTPASLLKVPVMLAVLRRAQDDPELLRRRAEYRTRAFPSVVPDAPEPDLEDGRSYTVDELLAAMIGRSDNNAAVALLSVIDRENLDRVFEDLGLLIPGHRSPQDEMTVQEYATFFRILYNASYLDRAMSERALGYLAESTFDAGLRAGVPRGVIVAHKFGERRFEGSSEIQLHDCGIVYHPSRPYVLCVMTRGDAFEAQASVIALLSDLVYKRVDAEPIGR